MLNKHLDDSINTQALKTLEWFLENSSDGIAVINSKGIIEEYNQKFLKLFAIQEKDCVCQLKSEPCANSKVSHTTLA